MSRRMRHTSRVSGFTVVEIVVVIVLITILGVAVMSRFADSNAINGDIARDMIVSMARQALQHSLGRSSITLVIEPTAGGDEATIEIQESAVTIRSETITLRSLTLSGDINITDSCETTPGTDDLANGTPLTLAFGELGDLEASGVTGSTGAVTSAVRICINDVATDSVCVSPSGFAYAGDCDV